MIIAFDAKRAYHNRRGLGNYSRNFFTLLSQYAPEDMSFALFDPKPKKAMELPLSERFQKYVPETPLGQLLPGLWRSRGCVGQIVKSGADIYHGLSQELPLGIERTAVKTVVTMHDAIFMRHPELYDALYRKVFIKKNRFSCRVANRIVAISEQTKQDFIEFFDADPNKIDVIYQGCDNRFRAAISKEEQRRALAKYDLPSTFLLSVGAIERRKNIAAVIHALHAGKIDAPLVIVGQKTAYVDELEKIIAEYGLSKQIFFRHTVATDDLPALYHTASVFVYPSLFEGFGIPILEALCCQTPVITTAGSCFEETGGPSSLYVPANDTDAMVDALERALHDETLRKKMMADGLSHAGLFTDQRIANQIIALYQSLA